MDENQVVEYDITEAAIAEMSAMYMPLVITDLDDKEQFDAVHNARMVVKGKRIEVDKRRKELKADAIAWGKKVQEKANSIFALLEPLESHLKSEEDKVAQEKQRIEDERIAAIKEKVDLLRCINIPDTQEGLKTLIDRLENNLEITPDVYFEFTAEASQIKNDKLSAATEALETRIRLDKEKAEREAEAIALEVQRKQQAEIEARLKEQQDKIDEQNRKIEAEKAALEAEKRKAEQEKLIEAAKKEAAEQALKQTKEAAEQAERDRIIKKEADAAEAERKKALLPDKEKLEAFSQFLIEGITYPEVKSEEAGRALVQAEEKIEIISNQIFEKAQNL